MIRFEVGETYEGRFIGDYDNTFTYKIIKRTAKFVTIYCPMEKEEKRCKIYDRDGFEFIYPMGKYSMSPSLRADKKVIEIEEEVKDEVIEKIEEMKNDYVEFIEILEEETEEGVANEVLAYKSFFRCLDTLKRDRKEKNDAAFSCNLIDFIKDYRDYMEDGPKAYRTIYRQLMSLKKHIKECCLHLLEEKEDMLISQIDYSISNYEKFHKEDNRRSYKNFIEVLKRLKEYRESATYNDKELLDYLLIEKTEYRRSIEINEKIYRPMYRTLKRLENKIIL
ncbi:MAG: hypothetical protein GY679_01730 [Mycoplasma sp.]|nr:hypothetical protein [Mycoplasma sp.]